MRIGHPVYPVTRATLIADISKQITEPEAVLLAGLKIGGNVGELWSQHRDAARAIAGEVIQLQEKLALQTLDPEALITSMVKAFEGDPEHKCMGRSAPARLQRALELADNFELGLPRLRGIATT